MVNGSNGGVNNPSPNNPSPKRADDPLGNNSEIGRKLKQYFDDLVSDEVPDRFAQLLSQLESAKTAYGAKD